MAKAMEDSVDVVEVFPYEASDAGIFGNGLVSSSRGLIAGSGAMDRDVVEEWLGDLRDLRLEKKGDVAVKDCNCVG